jgi:hypothetical protein
MSKGSIIVVDGSSRPRPFKEAFKLSCDLFFLFQNSFLNTPAPPSAVGDRATAVVRASPGSSGVGYPGGPTMGPSS